MGFIVKSSEDRKNNQTNLMYFNQIIEKDRHSNKSDITNNKEKYKGPKSFGSQKVDLKDYLLSPDGYESVVYPIYFLAIPYIVGALVLFLFVAGASFDNFKLLKLDSFFIVWMIGYEIVATILLIAIFVSFLQYDDKPHETRHF